jgi:predicted enzyme related to lactoylglutathione lyase
VHELGGTTVLGKTKEGNHGWFMNFKDPEGNRFAAYTMAK